MRQVQVQVGAVSRSRSGEDWSLEKIGLERSSWCLEELGKRDEEQSGEANGRGGAHVEGIHLKRRCG